MGTLRVDHLRCRGSSGNIQLLKKLGEQQRRRRQAEGGQEVDPSMRKAVWTPCRVRKPQSQIQLLPGRQS